MLQRGDQCYTKDETLGNRAYMALCLLAMGLVNNDAMWRYFPLFPNFPLMKFIGLFFVSKFGYIFPIRKRLVGTYLG
jgi:hypothetical protein